MGLAASISSGSDAFTTKEVKGISAIFDIRVGEDNPLHPSFYVLLSIEKRVLGIIIPLPTLSVRYNRWSRNRELLINDILFLFLWLDTKGFSLSEERRILSSGCDASGS